MRNGQSSQIYAAYPDPHTWLQKSDQNALMPKYFTRMKWNYNRSNLVSENLR